MPLLAGADRTAAFDIQEVLRQLDFPSLDIVMIYQIIERGL
jgi:hypothetical protein